MVAPEIQAYITTMVESNQGIMLLDLLLSQEESIANDVYRLILNGTIYVDLHRYPLGDWTVFEITSQRWPQKTSHFVGYNLYGREGRVSSAIVQFDREKMTGMTRSGRIYKLEGLQGTGSSDGLHTWAYWCLRNEVTESHAVSGDSL